MKVLFVSNDPTVFDPGSAARDRMRRYAATIGELHFVSRAKGAHIREYRAGISEGTLHLRSVGGKLFGLVSLIGIVRSLVKSEGISVISAQDPFEHGLVALLALYGTNAKLHVQVHTDFLSPWFPKSGPFMLNRVRRLIADYVLVRADGIRVVSKRIQDSLQARYGTRIPKSRIIPIGISATLPPRVELPPHAFTFTLLTVGRLEPEKRIDDIIYALKWLEKLYPMVGLMIIGEGRLRRRLEHLVRSLGLSENVQFLGWRDDAAGLMQSAQAYIQASAYEGYGLTLVEAALARVPIITTEAGLVGEVLKADTDVLVAPQKDPEGLSRLIAATIEDVPGRAQRVLNAAASAKSHLAELTDQPERIKEDLESVLYT